MKILAIETSCDETAIALVEAKGGIKNPRFAVLENIISSQIKIHRPFGGVVPNLAKREHIKNLPIILRKILKSQFLISNSQSKSKKLNAKRYTLNPDYIAVTVGPGLEPALWTGINFAQELSKQIKKPLIGVNHMEGHLYSNWLPVAQVKSSKLKVESSKKILKPSTLNLKPEIRFPAIALIVSGGHTILLHMTAINKWTKLGETLDDAAGEAFDKVARMLELPYPGGPEIQKLAAKGNPNAIKFPRPMLNKPGYEFSFSGLKTSVLYYLRDYQPSTNNELNTNKRIRKFETESLFADIAASFQQAVIDVLVKQTITRNPTGYCLRPTY